MDEPDLVPSSLRISALSLASPITITLGSERTVVDIFDLPCELLDLVVSQLDPEDIS